MRAVTVRDILMDFDDIIIASEKQVFSKHNDYKDYEYFVSKIIQEFGAFRDTKIERNVRLRGVTQPGNYEIDVLVTIPCAIMEFKITIECKNWRKPVGREVVQKIINTKNAVNANKAAIVSPVGYTKEAVQVAKHYNIALWILNLKVFHIIEHLLIPCGPSEKAWRKYDLFCDLRKKYFAINRSATADLDTLKKEMEEKIKSDLKLVEFNEKYSDTPFEPFNLDLQCYSDSVFHRGVDGIDFRLATTRIAAEIEIEQIEMMKKP